jgi:hypothetical protein
MGQGERRRTPGTGRRILITAGVVLVVAGALQPGGAHQPPRLGSRGIHGVADARAEVAFADLPNLETDRFQRLLPVPAHRTAQPAAPARAPIARAQTTTTASSPGVSTAFAGLGDNGVAIPPDVNGWPGPTQLVVPLNSEVLIQSRSGGLLSKKSLNSFWSSVGGSGTFDPRVRYDPYGKRWIMISAGGEQTASSVILVAVSKTSDATSGWYLYRFNADASGATWADFPALGFTKDWIAVAANMLAGGTNVTGSSIWLFNKSNLYGGGAGSYTRFQDELGVSQIPATTYSASSSPLYLLENLVGEDGSGHGLLRLSAVTGSPGNESYAGGIAFPSVASPWSDEPRAEDFAPQLGSSHLISVGDSRIQSVVFRNGALFAAQTVFLPSTSPTRSSVQWWQIGVHGDVQQFGRVDDSNGARFFAYPSIAVNKVNDLLIGYARFTASVYAGAGYAFRSGADPANILRSDTLLKGGLATYYKTFGGGENRWGDYSGTAVDPVDDSSFWTIQQYAALPVGGTDRWGTWWGRIIPPIQSGTAALSFSPPSIAFASRLIGTTSDAQTLTVRNAGTAPLTISGTSVTGTNAAEFPKAFDECTGAKLYPAVTCRVSVRFTPAAAGARKAYVTITSTTPGSPHLVLLTGTGLADTTAPVTKFSMQNGAVVLGFPGYLVGRTTDDLSGIASVTITFTDEDGSTQTANATLTCDAGPTDCSWRTYMPLVPGNYTARAVAKDAVGNTESPGPQVSFFAI